MHGRVRWLGGLAAAVALGIPGAAAAAGPTPPQLAVQPDGRAHFAWDWFDGRAPAVQERWSTASGDFSETQWVSPAGQGALTADIGVDADGGAAIVWAGGTVRMRWREADGGLRPTQTLSTVGPPSGEAQAAVDPAGNTYVTWVEVLSGGMTGVVRARRRAADGSLGAIQTLSATTGRARRPRVVVDALGNAVYAWQRELGTGATVVETRRRAAGGTLSTVRTLSPTTGTHTEVDLGLDEGGAAYVSWLRQAGGTTAVQLRRRAAGGTLGAIQAVTAPVAENEAALVQPRIAVTPGGAAALSWLRWDPDNPGVGGQVKIRRRTSGGALSAIQTLNTDGNGGFAARIATDAGGNATVAWVARGASDEEYLAKARRLTAAGVPGPVLGVSSGGIAVSAVDLGVDGAGNAFVVSVAGTASGPRVEAARVTANGSSADVEMLAP